MKYLIAALFLISTTASADMPFHKVHLTCLDENAGYDRGKSLILGVPGPGAQLSAQIREMTIAGTRGIATFPVMRDMNPETTPHGRPITFIGEGFRLEIYRNYPLNENSFRSLMYFENNRMRIKSAMVCTLR